MPRAGYYLSSVTEFRFAPSVPPVQMDDHDRQVSWLCGSSPLHRLPRNEWPMVQDSSLTVAGAAADLALISSPHCVPYYPLAGHLTCAATLSGFLCSGKFPEMRQAQQIKQQGNAEKSRQHAEFQFRADRQQADKTVSGNQHNRANQRRRQQDL